MDTCVCPGPVSIPTIPKKTCVENFGQVIGWILQRPGFIFDSAALVTPNDIKLLASWTPLFTAIDDTKVSRTPEIENFIIPRTAAKFEGGGDNTTIDGVAKIVGFDPAAAIGQIAETPGTIISVLRNLLLCEPALVAYGINRSGQILARNVTPGVPATKITGISIQSAFVTDEDNNGYATRDKADFGFSLAAGWRDDVVVITPTDFNARYALWPA